MDADTLEFKTKLETEYGPVYDTTELQEKFEVTGFCAPFCEAIRKSDSVKGSLMFTHMPRFYYSFKAD